MKAPFENRLKSGGTSVLIILLLMQHVTAGNDSYIYCECKSNVSGEKNNKYFSNIFTGDYLLHSAQYKLDFADYIKEKYNDKSCILNTFCYFEDSYEKAEANLEKRSKKHDDRWKQVITDWGSNDTDKSNYSSQINQQFDKLYDDISKIEHSNQPNDQSLQNFNISVNSNSPLGICVRDHRCEDGDKVRVTVNADIIFDGEIYNNWDCRQLNVEPGQRYTIELYAVNGTGFKGNCDYSDVNTGEIRIQGINSQIQSWQHRSGTGSRAEIIVDAK